MINQRIIKIQPKEKLQLNHNRNRKLKVNIYLNHLKNSDQNTTKPGKEFRYIDIGINK